jgi:hypothetical protein
MTALEAVRDLFDCVTRAVQTPVEPRNMEVVRCLARSASVSLVRLGCKARGPRRRRETGLRRSRLTLRSLRRTAEATLVACALPIIGHSGMFGREIPQSRGELGPVANADLLEYVRDVALDGLWGEK